MISVTTPADDQTPTSYATREDPSLSWVRTPPPGRWSRLARCGGDEPDRFVAPASKAQVAAAVAVCSGCPVRADCRDYARSAKVSGVWGGEHLRDGRPVQWRRAQGG